MSPVPFTGVHADLKMRFGRAVRPMCCVVLAWANSIYNILGYCTGTNLWTNWPQELGDTERCVALCMSVGPAGETSLTHSSCTVLNTHSSRSHEGSELCGAIAPLAREGPLPAHSSSNGYTRCGSTRCVPART